MKQLGIFISWKQSYDHTITFFSDYCNDPVHRNCSIACNLLDFIRKSVIFISLKDLHTMVFAISYQNVALGVNCDALEPLEFALALKKKTSLAPK